MKTKLPPPAFWTMGRCLLWASLVLAWRPGDAVFAQSGGAAPAAPGVLLLRNGQVLRGSLTLSGDHWTIKVPEGEIRIRATEVDYRCASVEEAYARLKLSTGVGGTLDHLRLAQWCLRENLLDSAEQEIKAARAGDPAHPMLAMLQRRLELAREPRPLDTSDKMTPVEVTTEDLDRMVRGLSPQAIESFTQRVQPTLMNNCTAAGCHGPQSETGLRLLRVPADQPPSRRLTQRNLHAALQWIDRENPAQSKLLTVPLQPHGTAKAPIFTDQQSLIFARLLEWANQAARRNGSDPVNPVERVATMPFVPTDDAAGFTPARAMRASQGGVVPASYNAPAGQEGSSSSRKRYVPKTPPTAERAAANAAKAKSAKTTVPEEEPTVEPPASGLQQPAGVGTDPFDPELFNRRTGKP